MAEICIPEHQVPADILNRLKQIGLTLRCDPTSAKTVVATVVPAYDEHRDKKVDETDSCIVESGRATDVVHVTELNPAVTEKKLSQQTRHDVVHVAGMSTPDKNTSPSHYHQIQQQQQHQTPEHHLSKQHVTTSQHQKPGQLTHSQSEMNFRDRRTPSPSLQQFSPFKTLSSVESQTADESRRLLVNRSPRTHAGMEDHPNFPSRQPSRNPDFCSFMAEEPYHDEDDVVRVFPTPPLSAPPDLGAPTPPETPESEGKRMAKDVFTFDELSCTKERIRQNFEKISKIHDQYTPRRDVMRTPTPRRPSTPSTPSYRRTEVPRSPGLYPGPHRSSPVDYPLSSRTETPSPQPKKRACSEDPSSPGQDDLYLLPRDSLSPQPRKKLNFDGFPPRSHSPQAPSQRERNFDYPGSPYPVPTSRHALVNSGCEGAFPVSGFTADCDVSSALYFSSGRSFAGFETVDGTNRMALQGSRYAPTKKKRQMFDEDGSDEIAICTCAVMERNFLQMAECAYKRIRRLDASPADFERFRNELAQTNDILRETMSLMKHIRENICEQHKKARW